MGVTGTVNTSNGDTKMSTTFKTAIVKTNPGTLQTTCEDAKKWEARGYAVKYETRTIREEKPERTYRWGLRDAAEADAAELGGYDE